MGIWLVKRNDPELVLREFQNTYREVNSELDNTTNECDKTPMNKYEFIDRSGNKTTYSGKTFGLSPTLCERYYGRPTTEYDAQQFKADLKFLNQEQLFLLKKEITESFHQARKLHATQLYYSENIKRVEPAEIARSQKWIDTLQSSLDIIEDKTKNLSNPKIISVIETIRGGENSPVPSGVNEVAASELFPWPDEDDIFFSSLKYDQISIIEGLTAVSTSNNLVPLTMELNAEEPSTRDELLKSLREHYIKVCNENSLLPNVNLRITSIKQGSKKLVVKMSSRGS